MRTSSIAITETVSFERVQIPEILEMLKNLESHQKVEKQSGFIHFQILKRSWRFCPCKMTLFSLPLSRHHNQDKSFEVDML